MKNLRVMADATLPDLELWFPQPFKLTLYNTRSIEQIDLNDHEILLCRSTLRVNEQLSGIKAIECVATASSGTDHILANLLQQQNIQEIWWKPLAGTTTNENETDDVTDLSQNVVQLTSLAEQLVGELTPK